MLFLSGTIMSMHHNSWCKHEQSYVGNIKLDEKDIISMWHNSVLQFLLMLNSFSPSFLLLNVQMDGKRPS